MKLQLPLSTDTQPLVLAQWTSLITQIFTKMTGKFHIEPVITTFRKSRFPTQMMTLDKLRTTSVSFHSGMLLIQCMESMINLWWTNSNQKLNLRFFLKILMISQDQRCVMLSGEFGTLSRPTWKRWDMTSPQDNMTTTMTTINNSSRGKTEVLLVSRILPEWKRCSWNSSTGSKRSLARPKSSRARSMPTKVNPRSGRSLVTTALPVTRSRSCSKPPTLPCQSNSRCGKRSTISQSTLHSIMPTWPLGEMTPEHLTPLTLIQRCLGTIRSRRGDFSSKGTRSPKSLLSDLSKYLNKFTK